jgi:hypothetical protein
MSLEKSRNRFTHIRYQLKKSGNSNSRVHHQRNEIVLQESGNFPFPSGEEIKKNKEEKTRTPIFSKKMIKTQWKTKN